MKPTQIANLSQIISICFSAGYYVALLQNVIAKSRQLVYSISRCIIETFFKTKDSIMFDFIKEELETTREEEQALKQTVESEKQRIAQVRKETKKSAVRKIKAIDIIGTKLDAKKDEKALNEFHTAEEKRLKSIQSARRRALVNQNKKSIIRIGAGIAAVLVAVSVLTGTGNSSSVADISESSQPAIVESGDKSSPQVQEGESLQRLMTASWQMTSWTQILQLHSQTQALTTLSTKANRKIWSKTTPSKQLLAAETVEPQTFPHKRLPLFPLQHQSRIIPPVR